MLTDDVEASVFKPACVHQRGWLPLWLGYLAVFLLLGGGGASSLVVFSLTVHWRNLATLHLGKMCILSQREETAVWATVEVNVGAFGDFHVIFSPLKCCVLHYGKSLIVVFFSFDTDMLWTVKFLASLYFWRMFFKMASPIPLRNTLMIHHLPNYYPDRVRVRPEDLQLVMEKIPTVTMKLNQLFPWRLGLMVIFLRDLFPSAPIPKLLSN